MNNNIIYNKNDIRYRRVTSMDTTQPYCHDIGKWALVKICNYPLSTLNKNTNKIPIHVIHSLK